MYSQKEKKEITEAFLESGLSLRSAGARPGWPCHSTLSKWLREVKSGELRVDVAVPKGHAGVRSKHERHSEQTKARAVRLYEMGRRPGDIARLLGIGNPGNIRLWWQQAQGVRIGGSKFSPKPLPSGEEVARMPKGKKKKFTPEEETVRALELENEILRLVLADLKVMEFRLESISNRKKTEYGERLRQERGCSRQEVTAFLKISKTSYSYHLKAMKAEDRYAKHRERIKALFRENDGNYGYRRIWAELRKEGLRISEKVVRKIMRQEGLVVVYCSMSKYSSYKGDVSPAVENHVKRSFHADAPNVLWLTDITQFKIPAGRIYLSPMYDCFDGAIVAWSISTNPNAELVNTMLDLSIAKLAKGELPTVHSDQGAHYRWPGWIKRMEAAGLTRSMSKKGFTPDNAACEGLFGRIKNEFFYHRSWHGVSIDAFTEKLDEYLRWYNESRTKKSLGYLSPTKYRKSLGLAA